MGTRSTPKTVRLVPLLSLPLDTQMKLRDVRNEEGVRRWMYTDHVIESGEHMTWMERLKTDTSQLVFAVLDEDGKALGVASTHSMDLHQRRADWAYYLTKSVRGGLGAALEYAFIDFVMNSLGIEKLNCEVIQGNDAVMKLHRKFLFEEEGLRRSNILKNGSRTGVHMLGLTKEQWLAGREIVYDRYRSILDRFTVSIEFSGSMKVGAS